MMRMARNLNYKKLSSHGSINIPIALRRAIGIQGGDPMEVSLDKDGNIIIKPYSPRCMFCESTENVKKMQLGKFICSECTRKAAALMEGEK